MKMKLLQKGFTLIELMIAVAIVAILAAIALPAYLDYTTRAKISEGIVVLDGLKLRIEEVFYTNGKLASTTVDTSTGMKNLGKYIASASIFIGDPSGGTTVDKATRARVKYNAELAPVEDRCLDLVSSLDGGTTPSSLAAAHTFTSGALKITWVCTTPKEADSQIADNFLPSNCRGNTTFQDANKC